MMAPRSRPRKNKQKVAAFDFEASREAAGDWTAEEGRSDGREEETAWILQIN